MFYSRYIYLCSKEKISPSKVASECGFNKGSVSFWKKKFLQGEDVYPSADILLKIANHFDVSVDYLLENEPRLDLDDSDLGNFLFLSENNGSYSLLQNRPFVATKKEIKIIKAYRSNPQKQKIVDDILNIKTKKDDSK